MEKRLLKQGRYFKLTLYCQLETQVPQDDGQQGTIMYFAYIWIASLVETRLKVHTIPNITSERHSTHLIRKTLHFAPYYIQSEANSRGIQRGEYPDVTKKGQNSELYSGSNL